MNQAVLEGSTETRCDLDSNFESLRFGNASLKVDQVIERPLVHEFHREIESSAIEPRGVDANDVRVVDRGGNGRFGLELGDEFLVVGVIFTKELDRDVAIESWVVGFVDNPHSAAAGDFDELEPRNLTGHLKGQTAARAGNSFQRLALGGIEERFAVRANL
jgi:hypothetical protein